MAVKVVGLAGQQAAGLHRLLLGADLTLGAALQLAYRATGVILPCTPASVRRIDNDPRVNKLLYEACANNALFVVQQAAIVDDPLLANLPIAKENLIGYDEASDLIAFAHSLTLTLANHPRGFRLR